MNPRLRKELSIFAFAAAAFALRRRNNRTAAGLGLLGLALRYVPLPSTFNYRDRHVVITGGSRGLGLELARQLLDQGAKVSLLARDADELNTAVTELCVREQAQVTAYVCDVTRPNELMLAFNSAHNHFGQIDMLINNAGSIVVGPFESMEDDDFRAQMRIYFDSVVEATRQLTPYFKRHGGGRIVNINSVGGKIAVPHMSAYCAAKFAQSGFAGAMNAELNEYGIRILTVYPGLMRTGSPIQAVFKGDSTKEFGWFAAADLTPGISVSPENAARQILATARTGASELVISWPAKLGVFLNNNFPELTGLALKQSARLMPHGHSLDRRTGAQVYGWFKQMLWARPWSELEEKARARYNQTPQPDAEYALGVQRTVQ